MKTQSIVLYSALSLALPLGAAGCGGSSYEATGVSPVAGAEARFEVEEIRGPNTMVRVRAEHLAPPERLAAGSTDYIVWFDEAQGVTKAGRLDYDEGERTGRMRATSPDESFTVFVTAEPNRDVTRPSRNVVFEQRVER